MFTGVYWNQHWVRYVNVYLVQKAEVVLKASCVMSHTTLTRENLVIWAQLLFSPWGIKYKNWFVLATVVNKRGNIKITKIKMIAVDK